MYPNKYVKVGLLSNGVEDTKGNVLTKEVFQLLKESNVNFIGNIEGSDVLTGKCDIVVCDGFRKPGKSTEQGQKSHQNFPGHKSLHFRNLVRLQ